MDINRLTEKSQEALRQAQSLAVRRSHQAVDVEHLLAVLVESPEGVAPSILSQTGVPLSAIKEGVERELNRIPQVTGPSGGPEQTTSPRGCPACSPGLKMNPVGSKMNMSV